MLWNQKIIVFKIIRCIPLIYNFAIQLSGKINL